MSDTYRAKPDLMVQPVMPAKSGECLKMLPERSLLRLFRIKRACISSLIVVATTTLLVCGASAQDTPACLDYYEYAKQAGSVASMPTLQRKYEACLQSRAGRTGNVGNPYCDCPVGSRCVDGGNRCEPLGNASDECQSGYVREWNGDCIPRSSIRGRRGRE